jgi:hypothetical protein
MKLRWYLDEDTMARALVTALRARGVDLLTPIEAGLGLGLGLGFPPPGRGVLVQSQVS